MDLQNYFAELEAELLALGMSETQSKAYCKRLLTSLSVLDEKTRQEKMQGYGTPAELAKRVGAIAAKQAPQATPTQDEEKSMEHTVNVGGPAPVKTRQKMPWPVRRGKWLAYSSSWSSPKREESLPPQTPLDHSSQPRKWPLSLSFTVKEKEMSMPGFGGGRASLFQGMAAR